MPWFGRWFIAVLLGALSCAELACTEPQQRTRPATFRVLIEADSQVQSEVTDVEARVERRTADSAGWELRASQRFYPDKTSEWPLTFMTDPETDTPGATYQLVALARDPHGAVVAEARVVASYGDARRDGLRVLFDVRCLGRTALCGPDLTCRGGNCVSSKYDPEATPTKTDTQAATANDSGPAPSSTGIAAEKEACDQNGARRCAGFNSGVPLACEGGRWVVQAECTAMQRCDTSERSTRGTCRAIPSECIGQTPETPFCKSETMNVCDADLLRSEPRPCAENERCAPDPDGGVTCACRAGMVKSSGGSCEPAKNCDSDNGGCDRVTECRVSGDQRVCGPCPPGWGGSGDRGCVPVLAQLDIAGATLTPAFSPDVLEYQVDVGLLTQTLSLSATAPGPAKITCNGASLESGASWTSPVLALGQNPLEVSVASEFGGSKQYRITVQRNGAQQAYIKADYSSAMPFYGYVLELSGDTMIVAAPYEDSSASGINGAPADASARDSGALYVYVRNAGTWTRQAYIKAPSVSPQDYLGYTAALEGDTIAVGVPRQGIPGLPTIAGRVFIYTRRDGVWSQQAQLAASDSTAGDGFGYIVALEGDRLVVGAPGQATRGLRAGAVYVFTRKDGRWTEEQKLTAAELHSLSGFGSGCAISADTLAIGAITDSDAAENAGAVYIFALRSGRWVEQQRLQPEPGARNAMFSLGFALRGDMLVVGAPRDDANPGEAHVFTRAADRWTLARVLRASPATQGDSFGYQVMLTDNALLIGAPGSSSSARGLGGNPALSDAPQAGAAYLYAATAMGFQLSTYLKSGNAVAGDFFGASLAITADTLAIGAPHQASSALGINPSAEDASSPNAGAVYVFQ